MNEVNLHNKQSIKREILMSKLIVIALGGNAIKQADEKGTAEEQFRNVRITSKHIVSLLRKGYRVVVTHGNGPQAGALMIQQEEGKKLIPPQALDIVGAMTQGQIGYMLQNSLINDLKDANMDVPVATLATQVLVDKNDPDFNDPSKPVGPFYTEAEAETLKRDKGYTIKKVKPTGDRPFRRVVPSPDPIATVEKEAIKRLVDAGVVVIASGGGGIPVRLNDQGHLEGVEAVIDKDLAGERLAEVVKADILLILTDVEKAKLNFAKPGEREIDEMLIAEAKKYSKEGHFLAGSMGPKVKACIRFLEWGGERSIITSLNKAVEALDGKTGTQILRG
ncbi:MAG TPA: carbamate kinase [Candidatus Bathyarchaeia archaeon]|nr:carbamate kinase [Candidatus Bathyarchaeia archaeon]